MSVILTGLSRSKDGQMPENDSTLAPNCTIAISLAWQSSYIVVGLIAAVPNIIIAITVFRHRALRKQKEYLIIFFLALADATEGLATALGGSYRMFVSIFSFASACVSPLWCMFLPQSLLWRIGDVTTGWMLTAVSLDRLISIYRPLKYFGLKTKYTYKLAGSVYACAFLFLCCCWVHPFQNRHESISPFCVTPHFLSVTIFSVSKVLGAAGSSLSVFIYVAVFLKFSSLVKNRVDAAKTEGEREYELNRNKAKQRKMTVTLGISCLFTLVLDSLPRTYGIMIEYLPNNKLFGINLSSYFFGLNKFNAFCNFLIFTYRHWELRHGLKALFQCKELPPNVELWKTKKKIVRKRGQVFQVDKIDDEIKSAD